MTTFLEDHGTAPWSVPSTHSARKMRPLWPPCAIVEPNKGKLQGTAARVPFDAIMERVIAPPELSTKLTMLAAFQGGGAGPKMRGPVKPLMHMHGGWFNWGSATGISPPGRPYRSFCWRCGVRA